MTDWPIIAQPPMPPNSAEAMLATPCPAHSRFLLLGVSVMSSTICAVSSDSSRPTAASVSETGSRMRSVSRVSGTCGRPKLGSAEGSSPRSATVRTSSLKTTATDRHTAIATSGDGTARVTRGSR